MVLVFIMVGVLVGTGAATVALLSGGSILFALLCYSVFGSLSALLVVFALYMRDHSDSEPVGWIDADTAKQPVSA